MNDIYDIVYVKTEGYSASNNQAIAWEIEKLNRQFLDEGKGYVLVVRPLGKQRHVARHSCEVASHLCCARDCGGGADELPRHPSQGTHFSRI